MLKPITLIALVALPLYSLSQSKSATPKKTAIGVCHFEVENPDYSASATELQAEVNSIIDDKKNLTHLDKAQADIIEKERDVQKNAEYIRGSTVAQDKAIGATMLLTGKITLIDPKENNIKAPKIKGLEGLANTSLNNVNYTLSFSLSVISVETNEVLDSKTFSFTVPSMNVTTKNLEQKKNGFRDVVRKAKPKIDREVGEWINGLFPPGLTLASIDTRDKKNYPKTVLVMPDMPVTLKKGDHITIIEVTEMNINGEKKKRKKEVGGLKVVSNEGDFINCEVTDGEKELEEKMKAGNLELKPKS